MNEKCNGCDLYTDGHCTKVRKNGACTPSDRSWLDLDGEAEFIPVDRMCRHSSIYGNDYIALTMDDIERLKNGEILHLYGEYGTFIGLAEVMDDER